MQLCSRRGRAVKFDGAHAPAAAGRGIQCVDEHIVTARPGRPCPAASGIAMAGRHIKTNGVGDAVAGNCCEVLGSSMNPEPWRRVTVRASHVPGIHAQSSGAETFGLSGRLLHLPTPQTGGFSLRVCVSRGDGVRRLPSE